MLLLTLLPLAGWAQNLPASWTSGKDTQGVPAGAQPAFEDYLTVTGSGSYTSTTCEYSSTLTWTQANSDDRYWDNQWVYYYRNKYNYSVHLTSAEAASSSSTPYTGTLTEGETYYLRVWGRYRSGNNTWSRSYKVLTFKAKQKATVTGLSLVSDLVYNDKNQSLVSGSTSFEPDYDKAKGGVKFKVIKDDTTPPSATDPGTDVAEGKDAGKYYVYIKALGDDDLYADGDWSLIGGTFVRISQRAITAADFTFAAVDGDLYYTGSAQKLAELKWTDDVARGIVTYKVDGTAGPAEGTNAKTSYTITAEITPNANHSTAPTITPVTKEIKKEAGEFTTVPVGKTDVTYNVGPQFLLSTLGVAKGGGTVRYRVVYTPNEGTGYENTTNASPTGTNAGKYEIYYSADASDNYTAVEATTTPIVVTIKKKANELVTAGALKTDLVYNGEARGLIATAPTFTHVEGTDGIQYFIDEETTSTSDDAAVKKTDAGEYTISYTVNGGNNYESITKTAISGKAKIAQAPLNLGLTPLTVDYGTDVTAEKIFTEVITSDEWVAGEDATEKMTILLNALTITTSKDGATAVDGLSPIVKSKPDAGVYTIALAKKDPMPGNYNVKLYSNSTTVTINKVDATLAVLTPQTPVYDGNPQALVAVGTPAVGGEVMYFVGDAAPDVKSTDWKAAIPEETTAGTYNVWQKVKGDDNHNDVVATAAVEVEFQKAPASAQVFTWTKTGGFVYGSELIIIPEATALENAAIEYSYAKKGGTFGPAPTTWTVGTWVVKAISAETANYKASASDQEFTVTKAGNKITDFAIEGWTYGDTPNDPTADADFKAAGEPTFTYSNKEDGTFTTEVPVNAGTWYVKASVAGTTDYDAAEDVIEFVIAKADVAKTDIVAPAKINLTYNATKQTLVDPAKFKDGVVRGTFEYSLDNKTFTSELPKGDNAGAYTVYTNFIPNNNYNDVDVDPVDAAIEQMKVTYTLTQIDNWEYNGKEVKDVPSELYSTTTVLPGDDQYNAPFKFQFPETVKDAKDYDFHKLNVVWADGVSENYEVKFSGNGKFTITPKPLTEGMITLDPASAGFTGDNITVGVTVFDKDAELKFGGENADVTYVIKNGDATVENGKIKDKGTYNFIFTATNNYKGEVTVPFEVAGMSIATMLKVTKGNWDDVTYDGKSQAPEFKLSYTKDDKEVVLQKGTDYDVYIWKPASSTSSWGVSPENVKDVAFEGKPYEFSIEAKGNYSGTIKKYKKINPKALEPSDFTVTEKVEYTSEDQMPSIVAKSKIENLKEGTDYKVYLDGAEITKDTKLPNFAKTYVFTFEGMGNYKNAINKNFVIEPATVLVTTGSFEKFYDGQAGVAGAEVVDGDVAWTYSGLKGGDGITDNDVVVADGARNVKGGAKKNQGTYQLTVDASKFSVSDNYKFVAADEAYQGKLTIKKAPVTLGFQNVDKDKKPFYSVSKVYGVDDKDVNYLEKVVVLENDEESPIEDELDDLAITVLNKKKGMTFSRATAGTEEVGKYDNDVQITINEEVFDNYVVATEPGNFEITKANITVALMNDIEVVYDGAYPAEELANIDASQLAISGLKWTDDYSALKNVKGTIVDDKGKTIEPKDVGTYILKLEAEADDYTVKTLDSRLIITPAPLTIAIADQTVYVGAKNEDLDMGAATIKGIIGNDAVVAKMELNASTAAPVVADKGVKLTIGNTNYQIVEKEAVEAAYGKLIVIAKEDIALDDTKAYTLPEKETTADVTFTTRVVNEDTWNVCVLPFETSPAEISDAFGYAAVDVLDDTRDDGNIHFQIVTSGVIPAGTPFIFKPSKDADDAVADFDEVTFESVKIVKSFAAPVTVENGNTYVTDKAGNKFWGTFKSTSFFGKQYWYMSKGAWKDASKFTDAKPVTVKPFRAFVEFVTPAAGRIFIEEPDGTETAIDAIEFNQMVNGEATYTLDGKKVNNVTQKGIYIKDGKKVAVK